MELLRIWSENGAYQVTVDSFKANTHLQQLTKITKCAIYLNFLRLSNLT